ncbi:MAG: SRPBCC domain-containing protein [Cytophagales bacterium]|nr:SRPBCC domain-containing protein [Cytophagales bacterium]
MKVLKTAIDINASKENVWNILVNFDNYPKWNPFIKSIRGDLKVRKKLEVMIQPPGSKVFKLKPKVTSYKQYKEFSWLDSILMYGLFDGHHIFEIEENGNGTSRLIHKEEFSGILVPLLWNQLEAKTRTGFELMNKAVKELAESE